MEEKTQWEKIVDALKTTHTTTTRDICQLLQCSRTWVNNYITPFVPYIRLSQGYKKDHMNWVLMARKQVNRNIYESVWYDTQQLYDYLDSHIISVTAQTKLVSIYDVLDEKEKKIYISENQKIFDKINEYNRRSKAIEKLLESLDTDIIKVAKEMLEALNKEFNVTPYFFEQQIKYKNDFTRKLMKNGRLPDPTKRTLYSRVDVPIKPSFATKNLRAVHDIKSYGDSDEIIYRYIFRNGAIRVELALPDKYGKLSKKIYYHFPENKFTPADDFDQQVVATYKI